MAEPDISYSDKGMSFVRPDLVDYFPRAKYNIEKTLGIVFFRTTMQMISWNAIQAMGSFAEMTYVDPNDPDKDPKIRERIEYYFVKLKPLIINGVNQEKWVRPKDLMNEADKIRARRDGNATNAAIDVGSMIFTSAAGKVLGRGARGIKPSVGDGLAVKIFGKGEGAFFKALAHPSLQREGAIVGGRWVTTKVTLQFSKSKALEVDALDFVAQGLGYAVQNGMEGDPHHVGTFDMLHIPSLGNTGNKIFSLAVGSTPVLGNVMSGLSSITNSYFASQAHLDAEKQQKIDDRINQQIIQSRAHIKQFIVEDLHTLQPYEIEDMINKLGFEFASNN